jgi:acetyl-CoA acetyltransferase
MVKLGKYSRSVSIIGVGCTPFMNTVADPETNGLTESELFGYAAIEAMKDAGISPKDIQFYVHGQAASVPTSDTASPNVYVNDWFGSHGLGSISIQQACSTGYLALDIAAQCVASGKFDFVLACCFDFGQAVYVPGKPAHIRQRLTTAGFREMVNRTSDSVYTRFFEAGVFNLFDDSIAYYMKKYNISAEKMDDALNKLAIINRRNASKNPLALHREKFEELAKKAGFDDVMDYMRSDEYNPKLSEYMRRLHFEARADGAAACILCPTEIARDFKEKPIEILGVGNCVLDCIHPHIEIEATREATRQVYELTGVKSEEIDLLLAQDFFISSCFLAAEETGYIPKGEVWDYVLAGRTAFDGDKPMNTNGGRCSFGHAHAASGLADYYEAVKQMRGQAGEHQIKKIPRTVMLRGYGGSQNVAVSIIRTVD